MDSCQEDQFQVFTSSIGFPKSIRRLSWNDTGERQYLLQRISFSCWWKDIFFCLQIWVGLWDLQPCVHASETRAVSIKPIGRVPEQLAVLILQEKRLLQCCMIILKSKFHRAF